MPEGAVLRELRVLNPDESTRLILGSISNSTEDGRFRAKQPSPTPSPHSRATPSSPISPNDARTLRATRTEPQLELAGSRKSYALESFRGDTFSEDFVRETLQPLTAATQTDNEPGNAYVHNTRVSGDFDRDVVAKDLETHTELVHSLWTDLKQWRTETKERALEEDEAVALALRHMRTQIESTAALSHLQLTLAQRLVHLAQHLHTNLPPTKQNTPAAFVLSGEVQALAGVFESASGDVLQTAQTNNPARCQSIEDGYGDNSPPGLRAVQSPEARRDELEAALQDVMQVCPQTGETTMSIEALLEVVANDTTRQQQGPTAASVLLEKVLHSREELGERIRLLTEQMEGFKRTEKEKERVHQTRLMQLMEQVKEVKAERDELNSFKETNKKRVETYFQAFSEYRDNMNALRGRCEGLERENAELRGATQHMQSVQSVPSTPAMLARAALPPKESPMPPATIDIMLSPNSAASDARSLLSNATDRDPPGKSWWADTMQSPSPVKPLVFTEAPIDHEFQALSQRMGQRIANLGIQLTSPKIEKITSLSPDYRLSDDTPTSMSCALYV